VLGGLARRVSFVEKVKSEEKPVLVVDSGQIFTDSRTAGIDKKQSLAKAQLISRAYKRMGVTAINIGDLDLMQGMAFLREESSRGLPLISANLVDPVSKKSLFKPYIIKKAGSIRIAFFGLLSPDINPTIRQMAGENFLVQDPVETAREMIRKLHNKADIIILLSNLGADREEAVVRTVSGIHFVLGGHDGRYIQSSLREGQTPVLESYRNGMYAGKLHLTFVKGSSPFKDELKYSRASISSDNSFLWTLTPLDNSLPEDREVSTWIGQAGFERD
jgi:2',3'-cyclic-nucleotide 2'-phosphodiesterase (5'-nucleotidase family)